MDNQTLLCWIVGAIVGGLCGTAGVGLFAMLAVVAVALSLILLSPWPLVFALPFVLRGLYRLGKEAA